MTTTQNRSLMKSVLFADATLYVRTEFHGLYTSLSPYKKETEEISAKPKIFSKHIETFLFCALLAKKKGIVTSEEDFASFKRKELIRTQSFNDQDKAAFLAVAFKKESFDFNVLHEAEVLKGELERYADAGMTYFLENCLADFVTENELDGETTRVVDTDQKQYHVEKSILSFIKKELAI